jgi:glycosyltransferase involved in cell wall biosynthesis
MKILHLSTSENNGGASRAAYRLQSGLIQQGIESRMFVRDKKIDNGSVICYKYPKGLKKAIYIYRKLLIENDLRKHQSTRPAGFEVFSDDRSPLKTGFFDQLPDADIYNLHWISGFVDLPAFFTRINKPLVWTLHDMFPFTGGCHYNSGCENYLHYCHNCPQLGSKYEKDLSYKIWARKRKTISKFKNRIIIRADSHWLANEAKKSSLFKDLDIDTIHYGIETDEFIPRDKIACRKALNIPVNCKVIVFGAPGIDNPRKGFKQLNEALQQVRKNYPDLFLLSFGTGEITVSHGIPRLHLGHVANNHLLSFIYNCGDIFVIPSLQEAFGQTALEAMSCEVPVVGFNTGGIPDMITNGITGYMAETGNINNLAEAINEVLSLQESDYINMGENCRQRVLNEFTIPLQAEKYISVYEQLQKKVAKNYV